MDKTQVALAEQFGYFWSELDNAERQPWMHFYSVDKTGEVIQHYLPADATSMKKYLSRGFTLTYPEKTPTAARQVIEKNLP